MFDKQQIWVERYRPQTIDDCIISEKIKTRLKNFVEVDKAIPHMIFCGSPGTGKTSAAVAIAKELNSPFIIINASSENGIDVIRNQVTNFAHTMSIMGESSSHKIVILDESDNLSLEAQKSLRNLLETTTSVCRFIFTCNYRNKLIEPLHSRCAVFEFDMLGAEKADLMAQFTKRVMRILKENDITFDKNALGHFVMNVYPDFRKTLNELQSYSRYAGTIDLGIMSQTSTFFVDELTQILKDKNFSQMRKWIAENQSIAAEDIFTALYNCMDEKVEAESQPLFVIFIADYQYKSAFVASQAINLAAMFTEMMAKCDFK